MRYFYLSLEEARQGNINVYLTSDTKIENYKDISNYPDIAEYIGENPPLEIKVNANNEIYDESTRPTEYHEWNDGRWIVTDIEEYKNYIRKKFQKERIEKIYANITHVNEKHKEWEFQCRNSEDLENFKDVKIAADLDQKLKEQMTLWILADNTAVYVDYETLMKVLLNFLLRKEVIFIDYGRVALDIELAKTVEELENIHWNEGGENE